MVKGKRLKKRECVKHGEGVPRKQIHFENEHERRIYVYNNINTIEQHIINLFECY